MSDDLPPPTPVPPAAQAPYPAHPAPHPHHAEPVASATPTAVEERKGPAPRKGVSLMTLAVLGGGAAAVAGLVWSLSPRSAQPKKGGKRHDKARPKPPKGKKGGGHPG